MVINYNKVFNLVGTGKCGTVQWTDSDRNVVCIIDKHYSIEEFNALFKEVH